MASLRNKCCTLISLVVFGLVVIGVAGAQEQTPAQQTEAEKPAPPAAGGRQAAGHGTGDRGPR